MNTSKSEALTRCSEFAVVGPLKMLGPKTINKMPFIYLDGGLRHRDLILENSLEESSYVIGDNDSFRGDYAAFDHLLPVEKDHSDFAAALFHLQESSQDPTAIEKLHLYGLLGKRLDHQLAIFGELQSFLLHIKHPGSFRAYFYSEHQSEYPEVILFIGTMELNFNGTFSILALRESTKVTLSGDLKYPLNNHQLSPLSSHGLSNESFGPTKITTNSATLLIRSTE